ncbi:MAG: hypothetical protein R2795_03455 [Saprospiraceae bacterium]
MKNTLLLQIINELTAWERVEARKWLASPVHNEREDVRQLFDIIVQTVFTQHQIPDNKEVFQSLFPEASYDDQWFRLLCSYLYKCLEEWLNWRQWRKAHPEPAHWLLESLRNRGLDKAFARHEKKCRHTLSKSAFRNHQHYLDAYLLEQEVYLAQSKQGRGKPLNFQAQEEALQAAFMSYKLRLACLSIAHQRVSGMVCEVSLLPEILAMAEMPPYCDIPAVSVYYHVWQMYQDADNPAAFHAFEVLFHRYVGAFPSNEGRDLLLLGVNFCIRQINRNGNAFFHEALNLYKIGLDNQLLMEDGFLSAFTYANIAIIAMRSGEWEWVALFLEKYRADLPPHQRTSIYALNAARLAYHQQNHHKALLLLHQFDDKDFIHQLSARILQMKIFYEAGDFQLLSAHIKNTRAYLRRIPYDSYHKQIYSNIFFLTDQLMKLPPFDKERREQLRSLITTTEPLTERDWLLAQIDLV